MNKNLLLFLFLAAAALLQSCTKDTVTATVGNPNLRLQAIIDNVTWAPSDTINTTITYNSASNTKVFNCTATVAQKMVSMNVLINNKSNTPGFNLGTYAVDNTSNVVLNLFLQQKNTAGNYVFVQRGVVNPGDGTVVITAVDSVAKNITGTFNFTARKANYDNNGNVISVDIDNVQTGVFNKLPYTFISK